LSVVASAKAGIIQSDENKAMASKAKYTDKQKEFIKMYCYDGMSNPMIANMLQISTSAVSGMKEAVEKKIRRPVERGKETKETLPFD